MTTARTRKPKEAKLSELQLRLLEGNDYELKLARSVVALERANIELMKARAKLYQGEIDKRGDVLSAALQKEIRARDQKKGFLDTMEKKFKLTKNWGYCPDSGEIKQGEN